MENEDRNPNPIYLVPDILEEIFLRLPLKSLLKFKIVSKQWKSILESRSFTERRFKIKKKRTILAVGDRTELRSQGDEEEEIDMFYMRCDDAATRPSLACDGVVCIPVPGWVNVFNPSTGEFLRFPSGPDPVTTRPRPLLHDPWWNFFPGFWTMGFGRDKVSGSYKVVRMFFDPTHSCEILDVGIGKWRSMSPPSYRVDSRRKSVCVNGSIYWLELYSKFCLLALDLHSEKFRDIPPPVRCCYVTDQVVNLENHLAIASLSHSNLELWTIDAQEKTWTMTYSINVMASASTVSWKMWYRPVAVSEKGNLFFYDSQNRLFKYYPEIDFLHCLSSHVCVISSFVENLVPLGCPASIPKSSGYRSEHQYQDHMLGSPIRKTFRSIKPYIPNILLTTSLMSLVVVRYIVDSSRS